MSRRVLFDTSVLLPLLIEPHPHHSAALEYFERLEDDGGQLLIGAHGLAETFAGLTRLPGRPALSDVPGILGALREICEVVELSAGDYMQVIQRATTLGLVSGAIYDLIHVRSAEVGQADELVTFNGRDFRRMEPQGACRLVVLYAE